jgi:hypothetical protein
MNSVLRNIGFATILATSVAFVGCGDDNDSNDTALSASGAISPSTVTPPSEPPVAEPAPQPGAATVIVGVVRSVDGNNLHVAGWRVSTDADTLFMRSNGKALQTRVIKQGDLVRVKGTFEPVDTIVATEVILQSKR